MAMPDVAMLQLNVHGGGFRWDIDFELGPADRGADIHATAISNGSELLHWRRTLGNADLFSAADTSLLQHIAPMQHAWCFLYLWPPVPRVPALFDAKSVLADEHTLIALGQADDGSQQVVVSGAIDVFGESTPVQFHIAPSRGFAIERLRFVETGDEVRVTEWLEVIEDALWVPAATVLGSREDWESLDAGEIPAGQAGLLRETRFALDDGGDPAFSLASDSVPGDLLTVLPEGTVVQNGITFQEMVVGALEPLPTMVVHGEVDSYRSSMDPGANEGRVHGGRWLESRGPWLLLIGAGLLLSLGAVAFQSQRAVR